MFQEHDQDVTYGWAWKLSAYRFQRVLSALQLRHQLSELQELALPRRFLPSLLGGSPASCSDDRTTCVVQIVLPSRSLRPFSRLTVPRFSAVLLAGRGPCHPCSEHSLSNSITSAHLSPQLFFHLPSCPLPPHLPYLCTPKFST